MHKQGHEGTENRNLVWVGSPANIASRLTDVANKDLKINRFKVSYNPIDYDALSYLFPSVMTGNNGNNRPPIRSFHSTNVLIDDLSEAEFGDRIGYSDTSGITYSRGKFVNFKKEKREINFSPIILTEKVFVEYKKALQLKGESPHSTWQKIENHFIKDFRGNIYQANLIWEV